MQRIRSVVHELCVERACGVRRELGERIREPHDVDVLEEHVVAEREQVPYQRRLREHHPDEGLVTELGRRRLGHLAVGVGRVLDVEAVGLEPARGLGVEGRDERPCADVDRVAVAAADPVREQIGVAAVERHREHAAVAVAIADAARERCQPRFAAALTSAHPLARARWIDGWASHRRLLGPALGRRVLCIDVAVQDLEQLRLERVRCALRGSRAQPGPLPGAGGVRPLVPDFVAKRRRTSGMRSARCAPALRVVRASCCRRRGRPAS